MPVRNEEEHLARAVESIRAQEYPGAVRIFVAIAPSNDDTERIATGLGDDVAVVPNPAAVTPAGLNAAIRAGSAPVVVRVDGHSRLSEGYIGRAVETLRRTGAGNVGGMQVPEPETPFEEAVAAATTSWLGTGGAKYRLGGAEGPVDTVYLGVFDRAAIEAVGLFDERLVRNQDYELNIRLRDAGFAVWFDPELAVGYRPRGTWRALARQYYEYGYWKSVVLRLHPRSARMRQLMPPLAVIAGVVGAVTALRRPRLLIVAAIGGGSFVALGADTRPATRQLTPPLVSVLLSAAWGVGNLHAALSSSTVAPKRAPR